LGQMKHPLFPEAFHSPFDSVFTLLLKQIQALVLCVFILFLSPPSSCTKYIVITFSVSFLHSVFHVGF
jgi:hypothetical protein